MLCVKDLNYHYGKIHALNGVSFDVYEGEIVSLIGSNGAGKTTLLRTISGLLGKNSGGTITFEGKRIDGMAPHRITALKLEQVLETRMVFPLLSVRENLMMGAYLIKDKKQIELNLQYCFDLFPRLLEREKQHAGTLSGGEQQMVAVARALMGNPRLLMLDEPSMGLAPLVVQDIFNTISKINRDGVTILLVEQNANAALKIANRAYVQELGAIVKSGLAEEIANDDIVRKTYLGIS
ncbi:ABC transporter ATP-binding protein [Bacillota bacterium Meth-B3]|nr:ABC transporter ATP-binding protein [Christensenellaceae bacterium]MEA5070043.1 ABC transporter ATP-binding protein [Christensenellaceae bacterium]